MKWMIPYDKLGSDQTDVIEELGKMSTRPIWIQGYAGSGKSVLLLHSLKDYLVSRPRAKVCVVVFTRSLVDLLGTGLKQIPELQGKTIPVFTIYEVYKKVEDNNERFDAIFCDEIQDIPAEVIGKMKTSCTHFIIAGDAAQSIYRKVPNFEKPPASSQEISNLLNPISKSLKIIYRLTQSVISILKNVFPEMLEGKPWVGKEDVEVKLYKSDSLNGNESGEVDYCWRNAKQTKILRPDAFVTILLHDHSSVKFFLEEVFKIEKQPNWVEVLNRFNKPDYNDLNRHFEKCGVPIMFIGNGYGSLVEADQKNKIAIMTYHSSKGLDFDYVYLPLVGDTNMKFHSEVPVEALLLVAISRSKSGLTITFTGNLYPKMKVFLKQMEEKSLPKVAGSLF